MCGLSMTHASMRPAVTAADNNTDAESAAADEFDVPSTLKAGACSSTFRLNVGAFVGQGVFRGCLGGGGLLTLVHVSAQCKRFLWDKGCSGGV